MRTILLLLLALPLFAQTPSDCTPSSQLLSAYEWDIANMALRRMQENQSPDLSFVNIPQYQKDSIVAGLSAILNSGFPEVDSVFNLYCVHDRTSAVMTWQSMIVYVDTAYAWTAAWQNLNALTGNPFIDTLVTKYGLTVSSFNNYSFGSLAVLDFTQVLNIYALADSLEQEPAISLAEPNAMIGLAGKISYEVVDTMRYFNFRFEFSDCFDGCDNYREWQFAVFPDCSVEYLGFNEFGFFGIEPLPAPSNCNLFTSVESVVEPKLSLFPNPASDIVFVSGANGNIFRIHDLWGRNVISGIIGNSDSSIDVGALPAGIYFLTLDKRTLKFIKQ
jgi:hypothetical protein